MCSSFSQVFMKTIETLWKLSRYYRIFIKIHQVRVTKTALRFAFLSEQLHCYVHGFLLKIHRGHMSYWKENWRYFAGVDKMTIVTTFLSLYHQFKIICIVVVMIFDINVLGCCCQLLYEYIGLLFNQTLFNKTHLLFLE